MKELENEVLDAAEDLNVVDICVKLIVEVEDQYNTNGDPAHGMRLLITKWCNDNSIKLPDNAAEMVAVAAFYHDWYTTENRKYHHVLALEKIIKKDGLLLDRFSDKELIMIAMAAGQHRASAMPTTFHSMIAKIVASADRGEPSADEIIKRITLKGLNPERVESIRGKYGLSGYVKYPDVYTMYYDRERIHGMRIDIEEWSDAYLSKHQ